MDAADLYSGQLLAISPAGGGYVAPTQNSLKIAQGCSTLDPITTDSGSSFAFLCSDSRGQSVIQVPMK